MAQYTINIPDELLPAIAAEFSTVQGSTIAKTAKEYFEASVIEIVRQRAEQYQVGPYFKGIVQPRFLADGRGNPEYKGADAIPYVVIYPTDNDGAEWIDGDQWTDTVTRVLYKYHVDEEGNGSWRIPVAEEIL